MDNGNEIYVYENWKSDTPSLIGTLYVDGCRGKQVISFEYDDVWLNNLTNSVTLDPDLRNHGFILAKLDDDSIYELMSVTRNNETTLSATMIFSPYPQAYFPQLCITAIAVPGTEIGNLGNLGERFLDNQRIEGSISEMLDEAIRFVKKNMKNKTIINPETGAPSLTRLWLRRLSK